MSTPAKGSEKLTPEEVENVNQVIKHIQENIMNSIGRDPNMIRVILMGITGSGKSCIACALSKKDLTVCIGKGRRVELQGEGVQSGCKSVTREPSITPDNETKMIYCDCPGFEDTEGFLQEIINSFVMDCLFEKKEKSQRIKFKIMLVASAQEIDAQRGKAILQSILRLEEMFTNHDQLRNGIGLIITKGESDTTGQDYIDLLNDNPPPKMLEWCQFFLGHTDRIFLFPKPPRSEEHNKYHFDDRDKVIRFLSTNPLVDPDHQVALSETARLKMKNLRSIHSQNVSDKIQALWIKISAQFRKEQNSDEMGKWIDIMHEILKTKVRNAKGFADVIKNHIPNSQQYAAEIQSLAEYEIFDNFIDKVLYSEQETSCLSEAVRAWVHQAIIELEKSQTQAIKSEFQQKELSKQKEMIEKQDQLQKEHERKVEEMKQMLAQQTQNFADQQRRIEALQQTIANQSREISNLRNQGGGSRCLLI